MGKKSPFFRLPIPIRLLICLRGEKPCHTFRLRCLCRKYNTQSHYNRIGESMQNDTAPEIFIGFIVDKAKSAAS